jgi:hypothetical protein
MRQEKDLAFQEQVLVRDEAALLFCESILLRLEEVLLFLETVALRVESVLLRGEPTLPKPRLNSAPGGFDTVPVESRAIRSAPEPPPTSRR